MFRSLQEQTQKISEESRADFKAELAKNNEKYKRIAKYLKLNLKSLKRTDYKLEEINTRIAAVEITIETKQYEQTIEFAVVSNKLERHIYLGLKFRETDTVNLYDTQERVVNFKWIHWTEKKNCVFADGPILFQKDRFGGLNKRRGP